MKRIFSMILVLCLFLSGCGFLGERIREPVTFHYLCRTYPEELCCVLVSEEREASGHVGDLSYLLALYQIGPTSEELRSPLPSGTRIHSEIQNDQILLTLSDDALTLSDLDYSLACACLTLTCLDITDADSVTVSCGDRVRTMTQESLTLYDETETFAPTEETK